MALAGQVRNQGVIGVGELVKGTNLQSLEFLNRRSQSQAVEGLREENNSWVSWFGKFIPLLQAAGASKSFLMLEMEKG